jgi:ZIP family zinc transporter
MSIAIGCAAFVATMLGGLFALKFKDKLHLILGFSAGAILGVAFFDLLPEAIGLASAKFSASVVASVVAAGFMGYMILDRLVSLHVDHDDEGLAHAHGNGRGVFGAASLAIHSFLDGLAVGLAFQVSSAVGGIVAIAVLTHDFSDGINTVNLILKNRGTGKSAFHWLLIDAAAPVLGVIAAASFTFSETTLGLILATFCGFFLYIGATDLLPESHHRHPTHWTTAMTIVGITVLYVVIRFAEM